jgi:hypothetical protein
MLEPYKVASTCRFLITWDRAGSGREIEETAAVESDVIARLAARGFARENLAAVSFDPEVEAALLPTWRRVVCILSESRRREEPGDLLLIETLRRRGYAATSLDEALKRCPKETLEALVEALDLRKSPALYQDLGRKLSIPLLKTGSLGRISSALESWFRAPAKRPGG